LIIDMQRMARPAREQMLAILTIAYPDATFSLTYAGDGDWEGKAIWMTGGVDKNEMPLYKPDWDHSIARELDELLWRHRWVAFPYNQDAIIIFGTQYTLLEDDDEDEEDGQEDDGYESPGRTPAGTIR
jgi:hypothetical protein